MTTYEQHVTEDARLVILRRLADEVNYSLNEALLEKVLEGFGHRVTRDHLRNQLRWLEQDAGAVTLAEAGSVMVATITRAGLDHVDRKRVLEGVARPSPEA
ncbi:MAG: hypothetical protein AAGH43_06080 [Pseudomonadota bacterium]